VLHDEAIRLGVQLRLGADVTSVCSTGGQASATLVDGENVDADVVVVADGMYQSSQPARSLLIFSD
jgi:2-polyprenyl-6-methoxyphenol hydroxylase-like FAD-dependent oxidoreductase